MNDRSFAWVTFAAGRFAHLGRAAQCGEEADQMLAEFDKRSFDEDQPSVADVEALTEKLDEATADVEGLRRTTQADTDQLNELRATVAGLSAEVEEKNGQLEDRDELVQANADLEAKLAAAKKDLEVKTISLDVANGELLAAVNKVGQLEDQLK